MAVRVPFEVAISEKLLLKPWAEKLSKPQLTALKAFYGCHLNEEERYHWSVFQGGAVFDELGYPQTVTQLDYTPEEYARAVAVVGRRGGKTSQFAATVIAYEAALGGHENFFNREAQEAVCFLIAQDLKMAREAKGMIQHVLETSPLLKKEIRTSIADFLPLKSGVTIGTAPPNIKAVRGYAVPAVIMDEVGVWHKTADSANPDYEIERAVRYAQIQFPNRKRLLISSPYVKEGLLYDYWRKGTQPGTLILHAPTAALQNPLITRESLAAERADDAEAFERESLARFVDALSGFLSPALLQEAIDVGVAERPPLSGPAYIAALDPAFRHDAFAFTIVHHDPEDGVVQDVLRVWKAPSKDQPLNPASILAEIAPILRAYRVQSVATDQYQFESLKQLALTYGLALYGVDFTGRSKSRVFGSLHQLINQRRLRLLDHKEQIHELTILEKRHTPTGGVQIAAPRGRHDDIATVLALACHESVWLLPSAEAAPTKTEPTINDLCWETIKKRRAEATGANSWW